MQAFAMPSYYDGQIRLNLKGREAEGVIEPSDYARVCEEIAALLRECRDALTGKPAVADVERSPRGPDRLAPSEADLVVVWQGAPIGLDHPTLGRIGPLPYRRPGGHTGKTGFAYLNGPDWPQGDYGQASSFDVVPTVMDLMGAAPSARLSGHSLRGLVPAE
jgi:predicted AlkP superfamily phosphohydrolase/phosphomutase